MSNTSKGKGTKGSKFWMQEVVNTEMQKELNVSIGEELIWLSPLKGVKSDYLEYELRQKSICDKIGITEEQRKRIFSFWPNRQPQWDGIALSEDRKTLYLVEAKAHLSEMRSKISAGEESRKLIEKSMKEVFSQYYSDGNFTYWKEVYYQLGNRLTFLNKLNEISFETGLKVKLVLLNFVGDYTYKRTRKEQWENHYKEVFKDMIGCEEAPKDVIVVNFEVIDKGLIVN